MLDAGGGSTYEAAHHLDGLQFGCWGVYLQDGKVVGGVGSYDVCSVALLSFHRASQLDQDKLHPNVILRTSSVPKHLCYLLT